MNFFSLSAVDATKLGDSDNRRQFHNSVPWNDYPDHTIVPFPALSPTMEVGTIAKWEISEGDEFSAGSIIASIETDKATMDFEAQDDGIIAKILKEGPEATDLPVGTPIAIVVEEPEDVSAFADYVVSEKEYSSSESASSQSDNDGLNSTEAPVAATASSAVFGGSSGTNLLLPSARFLAESKGLDATGLTGSGKGGRVTKGDVLAAIRDGTPMPALVAVEENDSNLSKASTVAITAPTIPFDTTEDLPAPEVIHLVPMKIFPTTTYEKSLRNA
jgi:pyruvate dehydrogenase E2 component (dihydrolipoamide acetyltransferase)